jgi:TPR repeat protein
MLSVLYLQGKGVAKDKATALSLARKSAGQGHEGATCLLEVLDPEDSPPEENSFASVVDTAKRVAVAESEKCKAWGFHGNVSVEVNAQRDSTEKPDAEKK